MIVIQLVNYHFSEGINRGFEFVIKIESIIQNTNLPELEIDGSGDRRLRPRRWEMNASGA